MKKATMGAIAGIALLASLPATAQTVIFEDTFDQTTFDLSYNENLNSNLVVRQAGGALDSIWTSYIDTAEIPEEALQFGLELLGQGFSAPMVMAIRTNASELVATTAHLEGLAGNKYTVSFKGRVSSNVDGSSTGRSGFAIGSGSLNLFGPAAGATATGLSVNIFRDGRIQVYDGATKISVGAGATAPVVLDNTTYDFIATIDEIADTLDFIVTETGSGNSFTGATVNISGVDLGFERKLALEHNTDGGFPENWEGATTKQIGWNVDDLNITRTEVGPVTPTVIFRDTYDVISDTNLWDNLNTELATRQAVGVKSSTYTLSMTTNNSFLVGPVSAGQGFNKPVLMEVQPGHEPFGSGDAHFNLDTDFGANLAGEEWSLSYDGYWLIPPALQGGATAPKWIGFAVGEQGLTGDGAFSVLMFESGSFQIFSGSTLIAHTNTGHNVLNEFYTFTADFDEVAETAQLTYLSATTNMTIGTFSTSGAWTNSSRFVELRNKVFPTVYPAAHPEFIVDFRVDNLTIFSSWIQPPFSIGDITLDLLPGTNALSLTWLSQEDRDYAVVTKTDLTEASWGTNTTVAGTGGDVTVTTAVDQAQSFYRVVGE